MKLPKLLLFGIVVALPGCDNVTWGGIEVELQTSAQRLTENLGRPAAEVEVSAATEAPELPQIGPLLLIGRPRNGQVDLSLVGQLVGGKLRVTPDDPGTREVLAERLSTGRRFTLYSEGVRVGTLFSQSSRISPQYCGQRPSIRGIAELIPTAARARQFIAVEEEALAVPYAEFRNPTHGYDQRVASLNMMRGAIPALQATWPTSLLEIRRDIQVFQNPGDEAPTIAATFVYADDLRTGRAPSNAYSVFLLGEDHGTGYASSFITYRKMNDDGKGSPRFFDHLDWDGDGVSEVLLEVLGESTVWISGLDRTGDGWREVYHDGCGLPSQRSATAPDIP